MSAPGDLADLELLRGGRGGLAISVHLAVDLGRAAVDLGPRLGRARGGAGGRALRLDLEDLGLLLVALDLAVAGAQLLAELEHLVRGDIGEI